MQSPEAEPITHGIQCMINGHPFQYSCLENPIDREAWQATDHGVAKRWTQLSNLATTTKVASHIMGAEINFLIHCVGITR